MTSDAENRHKQAEYRRIKRWRDENPDKIRQYNRQYYLRKKNGLVEEKHTGKYACQCGGKLTNPRKVNGGYMMECKLCWKSRFVADD